MSEVWKPIPGWGAYEASSFGRIRRCGKVSPLLPGTMKNGYKLVVLSMRNAKKSFLVHRLVMLAFFGPSPLGEEVCHGDGDRANNVLSNLRYGSRKENMSDALKHGRSNRGERCGTNKYNTETILCIRKQHAMGVKTRRIANDFGIPLPTIWNIVNRQTWAWL